MRILGGNHRKRLIVLAVLSFISSSMFVAKSQAALFQRSGIQWNNDINESIAMSKQLNKPMLLKVSTDWCSYCKKMQRETFSDATVIAKVNENFVPVYIDGDKNKALVKQLGVRSFPTTVVVSPNQEVLASITGFRSAGQLNTDLARFSPARPHSMPPQAIARAPQRQARPSIFGDNCPVSPIETGKFVAANPKFFSTFRGYRVGFASQKYLEAFSRNPTKYWPVADGMCVVSAAHGQGSRMGDLDNGALYQGRIWFFADQKTRTAFESAPAKYFNWLKHRTESVAAKRNGAAPSR